MLEVPTTDELNVSPATGPGPPIWDLIIPVKGVGWVPILKKSRQAACSACQIGQRDGVAMDIDLDRHDVAVLLESLKYSKQRIAEAQGTPYEVRREKLDRLDHVAQKLRAIGDQE